VARWSLIILAIFVELCARIPSRTTSLRLPAVLTSPSAPVLVVPASRRKDHYGE